MSSNKKLISEFIDSLPLEIKKVYYYYIKLMNEDPNEYTNLRKSTYTAGFIHSYNAVLNYIKENKNENN